MFWPTVRGSSIVRQVMVLLLIIQQRKDMDTIRNVQVTSVQSGTLSLMILVSSTKEPVNIFVHSTFLSYNYTTMAFKRMLVECIIVKVHASLLVAWCITLGRIVDNADNVV